MGSGGVAQPLVTSRPWSALGLAAGPAAFISAWLIGGSRTPDYSPIDDAISRIAAVNAPNQGLMTAGFVAYGVAMIFGSAALRASPLRRAWSLAAINGVSCIAVAALPLDHSTSVDTWHGVAAGIGYASITTLPIVAAGPLREQGYPRAATLSIIGGTISGLCLVATVVSEANGFFQRLGLTVGDVWLVSTGIALFAASRRSGDSADAAEADRAVVVGPT